MMGPMAKLTKADEEAHIKKVGEGVFEFALAHAAYWIRNHDARLTGLDSIRDPIIREAALRATGFQPRVVTLGRREIDPDLRAIIDDLTAKTTAAAQSAVDSKV